MGMAEGQAAQQRQGGQTAAGHLSKKYEKMVKNFRFGEVDFWDLL